MQSVETPTLHMLMPAKTTLSMLCSNTVIHQQAQHVAGVMMQPPKATKDGYDVQMQTNHLSHFLLTSLLLPSLEAAAASKGEARIVNHSSSLRNLDGKPVPLEAKYMKPLTDGLDIGDNSFGQRTKRYQQTKLANSIFTLALKVCTLISAS